VAYLRTCVDLPIIRGSDGPFNIPRSIVPEIFGTFNSATATPNEVTLSHTLQTVIANFVRDPTQSPAPGWPAYVPGNSTRTLAKIAYDGNVEVDDLVDLVTSDSTVRGA
jgi:hypothetical protein